ncbi:MAG: aminoacyl-histidine dipeptidase [Epulopiscium sp. Nele67-Bin004]|nr:MAG: aminoacyl-histidine dipeptidase [Epulopiscium sp. Nele67-Bin004]
MEKIFEYFEKISAIPRGSGQEKAISDYMVEFAKSLNLEVKQDDAYNVYIYKPATAGYENSPTVILQGHLDMVWEKDNDTEFDFMTQGINMYREGDWIHAKGTTLGADNGVAIAYQMAVLSDNTLEHPAIECFMTTEEETGMGGVANMHPEYLSGRILLNMDTGTEGKLLVSCAGGARCSLTLPITWSKAPEGYSCHKIRVRNLVGGHSGGEIHHERANANVLMGRILEQLEDDIYLSSINGGSKDNVITRECEVILFAKDESKLKETLQKLQSTFRAEYMTQDPDITLTLESASAESISDTKIIDLLRILPNGVQGMSHQIENLVETSLNIGVIETTADEIKVTISLRSSVESRKTELLSKLKKIAGAVQGVEFEAGAHYPAWSYKEDSVLRGKAQEVYKRMYGKDAKIEAKHAGLECGFLSEKLSGVDIISIGPNMHDIHSPQERVSISSMTRVYEYVTELLKELK